MSGKKHYTEVEKRLFLRILKKYSHIIERKKSDITTLRLKEEAWAQISEEYNSSTVISSKRDVKQLKKNWSNLKAGQRDALTKEKQSCLATGGGPATPSAEVDPDIELISPHLMTTAPTIFSSNISTQILEERQEQIFDHEFIYEESLVEDGKDLDESSYSALDYKKMNNLDGISNDTTDFEDKESQDSSNKKADAIIANENATPATPRQRKHSLNLDTIVVAHKKKKANPSSQNKENADERSLKLERIRCLMDQERELAETKLQHEKLKQDMEIQYLKEKYQLELRAITASAELSEYMLREKTMH